MVYRQKDLKLASTLREKSRNLGNNPATSQPNIACNLSSSTTTQQVASSYLKAAIESRRNKAVSLSVSADCTGYIYTADWDTHRRFLDAYHSEAQRTGAYNCQPRVACKYRSPCRLGTTVLRVPATLGARFLKSTFHESSSSAVTKMMYRV